MAVLLELGVYYRRFQWVSGLNGGRVMRTRCSSQGTLSVPNSCPQLYAQWSKGLLQEEVGVLSN